MKVLYLLHNEGWEGSLLSFIALIKGITANKHIVVSLVVNSHLYNNEKFLEVIKPYNISLHVINLETSFLPQPYGTMSLIKKYIKCFISLLQLMKLVCTIKPDIIHTNTGVLHSGFFISKLFGIPHVWHLREYQDLDFNFKILPSKSLFTSMLNNSNIISITDDIIKHFNIHSNEDVTTIYNGTYSESDVCPIYNKDKYFLMASRLSPEKCHIDAIIAFSEFLKSHDDYKLLIAGEGDFEYTNKLKMLVNSLGIDNSVDFLGFCEPSDIKSKMQKCRSLIVPSKSEGFGRMTAECAFNGSYVIGRNSGGTKEILGKIGGSLYDGSVKSLTKELIKVAELSDDVYYESVKNMQDNAIRLCSIEQYCRSIYSFYEKILDRTNS